MRCLLLSCVLAIVSYGAPHLPKDEFARLEAKYNLTGIFGTNYNATAGMEIVADEAKITGTTAEKHLLTCLGYGEQGYKINDSMDELKTNNKLASLRFKSIDTVMDVLRNETPKTYEAIMAFKPVFEKIKSSLDKESSTFVENLRVNARQALFDFAKVQIKDEEIRNIEQASAIGKPLIKIVDEYKALSTESKNNLERETCVRTTDRILAIKGSSGIMALFESFADLGKMVNGQDSTFGRLLGINPEDLNAFRK